MEVRSLIHGSPGRSINQLAKQHGRCRKQLFKLYRLSHVCSGIIEAIVDGTIRTPPTRRTLLEADLPTCWDEQRVLFGLTDRA